MKEDKKLSDEILEEVTGGDSLQDLLDNIPTFEDNYYVCVAGGTTPWKNVVCRPRVGAGHYPYGTKLSLNTTHIITQQGVDYYRENGGGYYFDVRDVRPIGS